MNDDTLLPFDLPWVRRKKLTVDFAGGYQSSDGGLLLLREAERKLGVCRRLAAAMPDRRDPDRVRHAMFEMVMARAAAIACGYEDAIDLDRLRHDPLLKVAVGRCPQTGAPLASQSTISRLENAPSKTEAGRLSAALLDQFGATVKPGKLETLDIDDTFCAAHRSRPLGLERALRRAWFCVDAHLSRGERRAGGGDPAPGAHAEGQRSAHRHQGCDGRLRRHWPTPAWCGAVTPSGRVEAMDGRKTTVQTTFLALPAIPRSTPWRRKRCRSALLSCDEPQAEAAHLCELPVPGRQLEAAAQGRGAAGVLAATGRERHAPGGRYPLRRDFAQRLGAASLRDRLLPARAMENLIKLHKTQLASDRMWCHSATANPVRLVLHTAAFWLMHGVRAAIPKASPLAKCEFATIRERLIKIGARVIEHLARIRIQLPTSCPEGALFRTVALGLMPSGI